MTGEDSTVQLIEGILSRSKRLRYSQVGSRDFNAALRQLSTLVSELVQQQGTK